jgi:restriction endonuclease S subunit
MDFEYFKLTDFFIPTRGDSKYTKEYGNKNSGSYPVYSASNDLPLTNINHYDYAGDYLTWSTNGFGGFLRLLQGRFSINGDRGILLPKDKKIELKYIQFVLQPILREMAKGRRGENNKNEFTKVPLAMIEEVEIPIPVKKDNQINFDEMKKIANKFEKIELIKNSLKSDYDSLENLDIKIIEKYATKSIPLTDIFDIKKGNAKYTKKYIHEHHGEYPMYSSQTTKDGEIGHINTYDYNEECFTWTTDGIHAGTVFYRNGKFSITTHCGLLRIKDVYKGKLDMQFLKFILGQILPKNTLGEWANKRLGVERMSEVFLEIPVKANGDIDLAKQTQIAEKYYRIQKIKEELRDNYEQMITSKVQIVSV